ncbi:Putative AC transposase [Linum perenne]
MMEIIKSRLVASYLLKGGALLHMRCTAHILNLIVKDGLDVLKSGIEKIRDSVIYWTATPKRVEFFKEVAKQCRNSNDKSLQDDCPTMWNSTYVILSVALLYKDVFFRLKVREPSYSSCPSESQWEFAAVVCDKLKIFNDISKLFSGSNYPTVNLFFTKICELSEKLFELRIDSDQRVSRMAELMWLKFSKYWMDIHEVLAVAVVRNRKRLKTTPFQTELDNYLNEEIIPKSHDFDILVWWKMNGVKFPTLQAMARDLLAIPVTSVASESAFSAGGRILVPHRSKVGHDAVKAMLCTKTWVHDELRIGIS